MNATVSRWFLIQRDYLLLSAASELPSGKEIVTLEPFFLRQYCIEKNEKIPSFFCAELNESALILANYILIPIRQALTLLDRSLCGLAVKAYSIIRWDKYHQFCGGCGGPTEHMGKGFERRCARCELFFYPRISPSIIVLIKKGNQLLMARSPHHPSGVFGLIAGFVEVGETIEEAVHREVEEEVGLKVNNLNYYGSQPWPFPDSLMLAFTADYLDGELCINQDEISEAGWYRYDQLPGRPSLSVSIASDLIDNFVAQF